MSSRRCSICDVEWPRDPRYETCPDCGEPTWVNRDARPDPGRVSLEPRDLTDEQEALVASFRAWLDRVYPDDFKPRT